MACILDLQSFSNFLTVWNILFIQRLYKRKYHFLYVGPLTPVLTIIINWLLQYWVGVWCEKCNLVNAIRWRVFVFSYHTALLWWKGAAASIPGGVWWQLVWCFIIWFIICFLWAFITGFVLSLLLCFVVRSVLFIPCIEGWFPDDFYMRQHAVRLTTMSSWIWPVPWARVLIPDYGTREKLVLCSGGLGLGCCGSGTV